MKRLLVLIVIPALFSCTHEADIVSNNEVNNQMEVLFFNSQSDLLEAINNPQSDNQPFTKASYNEFFPSLFTLVSEIDAENDPVLSYEYTHYYSDDKDVSLYKALGYNELVPNEQFAALMNARGEFRVGDTIYKVSPRGTYYFPVSDRQRFETHYAEYEKSDGELISEKTYRMDSSIYRYDTFSYESDNDVKTKADPIPGYDWNNADTHVGSANSVLNNQLFYHTMSSDRRLKTRVYNHDYVVYQERGAYVKVQKKAWIGWSDITATELALGWRNIIMTKPYDGLHGPILPGTAISVTPHLSDVFNGQVVSVFEIFGYNISTADYNTIINGNWNTLRSIILRDTGYDIVGHNTVRLIGADNVQAIFPANFIINQNTDEVKVVFSSNQLGPCYKFAAGQFYYVGYDGSLLGAMRVGTAF